MIEIRGGHNTAVCFTDSIEDTAREQIKTLCDQPQFADSKIRIMPDVHAGKGCTIGTTMTITDKIVPSMVGVDIGCGMLTVLLRECPDFDALDVCIRENIPSGFSVRNAPHNLAQTANISQLRCAEHVDLDRAYLSIGTLGGGNHFIEIAKGATWPRLIIHSGSRHLGHEVATYYQNVASVSLLEKHNFHTQEIIRKFKERGDENGIAPALNFTKRAFSMIPKDLCWLEGPIFDDYIHDMKIVQEFADINRKAMADTIMLMFDMEPIYGLSTVHNYIDTENMILRKGAVSAAKGERLIIPINMRDGSLFCLGKGNPDWNMSAPHGAGRVMSRGEAFKHVTMEQYEKAMEGIYSTSVVPETLDESPMAYKPIESIINQIGDTVTVIDHIRPAYNFKAAEKPRRRKEK